MVWEDDLDHLRTFVVTATVRTGARLFAQTTRFVTQVSDIPTRFMISFREESPIVEPAKVAMRMAISYISDPQTAVKYAKGESLTILQTKETGLFHVRKDSEEAMHLTVKQSFSEIVGTVLEHGEAGNHHWFLVEATSIFRGAGKKIVTSPRIILKDNSTL